MSHARVQRAAQRGVSLIEVTVIIALVSMMSLALNESLHSTQSADQYFSAMARATERGQNLITDVAGHVASSRRLFQDDDVGAAYLGACDLARFPPAPGVRLPIVDESRNMDKDSLEASHTGNMLLLVTETLPTACVADPKTTKQRVIDTYRMLAIYPHIVDREVVRDGLATRDLIVWQSVAYPSLQQILEVGDKDEREEVVKDLVRRRGFTHAWDPGLPVAQAFYALGADGKIAAEPTLSPTLTEDPDIGDGPRLAYADVELASSDLSDPLRRPVLTAQEASGWKPHGFEIKVGGPAMSRLVWLRIVVQAAAIAAQRVATHAATTIVSARDY